MSDIFYDTDKLKISDKKLLIQYAFKNKLEYWIDMLEPSLKGIIKGRININSSMSFSQIIKKLKKDSYFVVINRFDNYEKKNYGEIGFVSKDKDSNIEYFLFIHISDIILNNIINHFELKTRNLA
jgi:hypothetical protein